MANDSLLVSMTQQNHHQIPFLFPKSTTEIGKHDDCKKNILIFKMEQEQIISVIPD